MADKGGGDGEENAKQKPEPDLVEENSSKTENMMEDDNSASSSQTTSKSKGAKSSRRADSGIYYDPGDGSDIPISRKKKKFKKNMKVTASSASSATDSGQPSSTTSNGSAHQELDNDSHHSNNGSENHTSDSTSSASLSNTGSNDESELEELPVMSLRTKLSNRAHYTNDTDSGTDSDEMLRLLSRDPDSCDPDEDESNMCFLADKFTKPKYQWHVSKEVLSRQYGTPSHKSANLFCLRCCGSLHVVERLELMYKMESHQGCVNSLNFNKSGTRLASGSDDLNIAIWDWTIGETVLVYDSGHRANVFQSKFLPMSGDCHIVSCARDGQVRLAELSSDGTCKGTRKVAHHRGSAHKLTIEPNSAQNVLSCGEDAIVFEIDLRESKAHKLLTCKNDDDSKVPLYAIHSHPIKSDEFIVGGLDNFVRVYDKRFIGDGNQVLQKISPNHLRDTNISANVTCCVYNHDGSEILASYNDEDIYLFNAQSPDTGSYKHRYQGHRNYKTVKGVNFFGPESQYVVSGSDCGNIYYWEKKSSRIVQCMMGDVGGVVNCLEPHPHLPVMATSGLDDDIKIWVPSHEQPPDLSQFHQVVIKNCKDRVTDRSERRHSLDSRMFWFIVNRLHRSARQRGANENDDSSSTHENNSSDNNDDDDDEISGDGPQSTRCVQS